MSNEDAFDILRFHDGFDGLGVAGHERGILRDEGAAFGGARVVDVRAGEVRLDSVRAAFRFDFEPGATAEEIAEALKAMIRRNQPSEGISAKGATAQDDGDRE